MFAPCKNRAAAVHRHIRSIVINHNSRIRTLTRQDLTFFHPWLHLCNMQIKFKQKMMLDFTSAVHKHLVTKLRSFYFCMCVYISMCIHLQIHIKFCACLNRLPAIFVFSLFSLPVVCLCFVVFDCSLFSILFISLTFMTMKQVCCKGHKTTGFTSSIFLIKSRHLKKKVE